MCSRMCQHLQLNICTHPHMSTQHPENCLLPWKNNFQFLICRVNYPSFFPPRVKLFMYLEILQKNNCVHIFCVFLLFAILCLRNSDLVLWGSLSLYFKTASWEVFMVLECNQAFGNAWRALSHSAVHFIYCFLDRPTFLYPQFSLIEICGGLFIVSYHYKEISEYFYGFILVNIVIFLLYNTQDSNRNLVIQSGHVYCGIFQQRLLNHCPEWP